MVPRLLWLRLDYFLVGGRPQLGPLRRTGDLLPQIEDQPDDPRLLLRVDLVGRVGGSVIVRVHAVEEEDDWHSLPREVVVVRAEVEALLRPAIVDRRHAQLGMLRVHP